MPDLRLQCTCGAVTGRIVAATPRLVNRLECYCKSCQAFPRALGQEQSTLNTWGGTDISQIPFAHLKIEQGLSKLACLRLTPKGLYRWYTSCCNTPVANTVGKHLPMVGIIHTFIAPNQDVDALIGPVLGGVFTESAIGTIPPEAAGRKSSKSIIFRMMRKLIGWKITGKGKPNPLFQADGKAIVKPRIIAAE